MAKKVTIDIEVNGKMQKATLSAKKLKQALDETKASQEKLDASTRKGYRAMQGSAQATSNSTKAFSKQAGVVGGLVPVYATFAANVFAVTAAFGVLKRAAALERLETSLERLGALSGRNLGALARDLRSVADEAISAEQALRAVSVGTSAGFSSSQILQLTEVAKGASLALGRDMGDAIDRLIRGTAKLEPEILDELGIIVRLDQAASDYATTINKTANELSQFEKIQAFVNATITQGLNKYQKIAAAVDPSPYDKLAASFADLTKEVVNFANAFLGPIVDFFATNKFALAGALTAFAGTLVKQVVPAIDEVVAKNRAIAATAQRAAKKSRQVIEGEYEKTAKRLKVLDVTPPIAKQIIPKVKAGEASIKDLKKAILSLQRSEKARDSQPANIRTDKYKQETAALRAQRLELEKLIAQEKGRLQYTSKGLNERTTSRIGRRTAAYGEAIDNAGFVKSLGIATEGVKRNAAEVAKAGDAYGKFGAAAKVAGSAVTLFGRAFLNLIPIIGQALFIFSILQPVLGDLFSKSAIQKSLEETTERFSIFTKTVALVKEELKETTSDFSQFAIVSRASIGVFDEIKQAFIRLGTTIDNELIEKYKEAIIRQQELQAAADRAKNPQAKRFYQEAADNIDPAGGARFGEIGSAEALALIASAEAALGSMGKVMPSVEQGIGKLKDELELLGIDGKISLEKILTTINELSSAQAAFIGNLKAATQQFADFRAEVTKLESRQVTPFSAAIEQSKEFQKSAQSALDTFFSVNPDASQGDSIELLKDEFPQAIEFAKMLEEETDHVISNILHFEVAMEAYNNKLEEANSIVLKKQGVLRKEEALLKEFARNEKIAAGFTRLRLEQEDNVIDAKINALKAERTMVDLLLQGNAEIERQAQITADIEALTNSKKSKEERVLINLQAQFAEKQRLAQIEQKIADITLKRAQQQFEQQGRDDERTLRSERQGNAFAFLDERERSLDLEIARTSELLNAQEAGLKDRENNAKALAELEFDVLSKRLAGEARIASMRAAEIRSKPMTPEQEAAAEELESLAGSLTTLSTQVGEQARAAGLAAADAETQKVDTLRASLEGLVESRSNLEGINVLIDGTAKSLESNMTSAFTALITGTKSAKQAFADMAKAILADIAAMIAKQLVLNMLIAATGGSTGFFGNLFGRQGGIFEQDPSMRYGGVAEKVRGYAGGGIAKGRQAGYPAILHGTEAVVPLPNGKEIPVEMRKGSGQTNNVTVNVNVDSNGNAQQNTSATQQQGANLGKAISLAVQKELQNQKRSGGILNPYGVA
jgi:hypothetical protein